MALPNIEMNPPQAHPCSPSWTPLSPPHHTITPGRPSAPGPSIQYCASNQDWRLISYMILYMFQCHILITDISLLCSCESQSFPGWPFLRKQTSADTILNGLTFSIQLLAAQVVLLQGLSIWGGWAYLLFWFCLILWVCLIFWYPFWLWFSFLRAQEQKKTVWFSCFLHLIRLSGIWSDFRSQGSFQRSSDPHGLIPYLERQEKGISFEERV